MPDLFSEFTLKDVTFRNRVAMSPMCQYSAIDGVVGDWHLVNLGARAAAGAALVVAEATAVSPEGRITPGCAGLWNDAQAAAFARIVRFIEAQGAVPGIQLAHAGRKAAANPPWREAGAQLAATDPAAWEPQGPDATPFGGNLARVPHAMTEADIAAAERAFAAAARRAHAAGFRCLMLHFAHGYLAQSFFSPLGNRRTDRYGGSFENRARFILETFAAVRAVWPEHLPLTARIGVTDFLPGEQPFEESIELVRRLAALGLDLVDVSIGFNTPDRSAAPWRTPAFMAPFASRIRAAVGIPVATSWGIREPALADQLVRDGQLDMVVLGKAFLDDPHWVYHAARALGRERPQRLLAEQYAYAL
jgi:2,4-dienoyl-CoA reductase-like NADH-dependent reductase (Old Yellow Enzyme family)